MIVAGIGELLWDILPAGRQIGGAPANFAYHSQVLGAESRIVTAVGDDEAGREIIAELEEHGLDTTHVAIDENHPTGMVSVRVDWDGMPEYTIHENVAWDFMSQTPEHLDLATRVDAVCFGSLAQRSPVSRKTIRSFLRATRPDCLRIYDVNLRQAYYDDHLIREALSLATVLKLNESELAILAGLLEIDGNARSLLDSMAERFSLTAIALTRGDRGCIIRTDEQTVENDGFSRDRIVDTVGAGDCFTAVLTVGLLRYEPLDAIAEQANRLAAHVCSKQGAMPEMP